MLKILAKKEAQRLMNTYGKANIPFLFVIDYAMQNVHVVRLDELDESLIQYCFYGKNERGALYRENPFFESQPVSFQAYQEVFEKVQQHIQAGNTYLTNLTFATPVLTSLGLLDIFKASEAKYKLWMKEQFVIFSPESFVQIEKGKISSFPMKGTIDARIENALEVLQNDPKEKAEHATIVDLIRNDLSLVATKVRVEQYRYFEEIQTGNGRLIQSSSKITGDLSDDYEGRLGDIVFSLLPAGSITGAPKNKTVEIIESAENYNRNFYTGVFGVFDGKKLDSAVAIRFIEKEENRLVFKSGGGITAFSDVRNEYQELLDKIYFPISSRLQKQKHATADSFIRNH